MNTKTTTILLSIAFLVGCGIKAEYGCKPALMPYVEYGYRAEARILSASHTPESNEIIEFHDIPLPLPAEWNYERLSGGKAIKFFNGLDQKFILMHEKSKNIQDDFSTFNLIGCNNFPDKKINKNSKDFYTDLYLFTETQINNESDFWYYYILWAKTKFLRNTVKLVHYSGKNIKAFQRIFDKRTSSGSNGIGMKAEIFFKNDDANYLLLVTDMTDDDFFIRFLEMVEAMNAF